MSLPKTKLAVLAGGDPLDVRTWSGTPYFMTEALQQAFPGLSVVRQPRPSWFYRSRKAIRKVTFGRVDLYWSRQLAERHASALVRQLRLEKIDVVVCIANSPLASFIGEHISTVHVSDSTVPLMRNYYSEFSRLTSRLVDSAFTLDRLSVRRAAASLYPSEWAAQSAMADYGAIQTRVFTIPWGANLALRDLRFEFTPAPKRCNLVFIGVDWKRKGGEIALATARHLASAGRDVTLHIVGSLPHLRSEDRNVILHGFINKDTSEGRATFDSIMREAAFLFVPTRQDAYGIVFPEANAFSVPVIATNTGGVPGAVKEGLTGHLLPPEATAEAYANLIWTVWSNPSRYEQLRRSARSEFDHVFNWRKWSEEAAPIIEAASRGRV